MESSSIVSSNHSLSRSPIKGDERSLKSAASSGTRYTEEASLHDRSTSPSRSVTRHGLSKTIEPVFGTEERFVSWQKIRPKCETFYALPEKKMNRSAVFGSAPRVGLDSSPIRKSKVQPGPYSPSLHFDSEFRKTPTCNFGKCVTQRSTLIQNTPSPGHLYNVESQYWNGVEKPVKVAFTRGLRVSTAPVPTAHGADPLSPTLGAGRAISMGQRISPPKFKEKAPGHIYDVHQIVDFKTGPAHSFAKQAERFKESLFFDDH